MQNTQKLASQKQTLPLVFGRKAQGYRKKEMKKENKKFPLTPELRRHYDLLSDLSEALKIVSKPYGFFWNRKIDTKAVFEISKAHAEAKSNFWLLAIREYPELQGKNASSDVHEIELLS